MSFLNDILEINLKTKSLQATEAHKEQLLEIIDLLSGNYELANSSIVLVPLSPVTQVQNYVSRENGLTCLKLFKYVNESTTVHHVYSITYREETSMLQIHIDSASYTGCDYGRYPVYSPNQDITLLVTPDNELLNRLLSKYKSRFKDIAEQGRITEAKIVNQRLANEPQPQHQSQPQPQQLYNGPIYNGPRPMGLDPQFLGLNRNPVAQPQFMQPQQYPLQFPQYGQQPYTARYQQPNPFNPVTPTPSRKRGRPKKTD